GGKVVASEHVVVRKDGVYRCAVAGQEVKPALCFLRLPAKKGEKWNVDSTIGGERVTGAFEEGEEEVPVAYDKDKKKVKAVTSAAKELIVNNQRMALTYYFAPGVGMVKQVANLAGAVVTLELVKYEPPKD